MKAELSGWTTGAAVIFYQSCDTCHQRWYFRRQFCPGCGNEEPLSHTSRGLGTIYSCSVISRPPSADLRSLAPYNVVLVDMDEGFRMMAHGSLFLHIGDRVSAIFREFGGRRLPYFSPALG